MAIKVDEKQKIFSISTVNTTYMMGVLQGGHLLHLYYGKLLEDMNAKYLLRHGETEDALYWRKKDEEFFFLTAAFEYPVWGTGDFRDVCLCVRDENGCRGCRLQYDSYRILSSKPSLPGLPATFGDNGETLEITLKDACIGLTAVLRYSVFADSDAIIKSVELRNEGSGKLYLEKALSSSLTLDNEGYELSTLHGSWGRERHIVTRAVTEGKHIVASVCGKTSHQQQPFMMLTSPGATQNWGCVYGVNFV